MILVTMEKLPSGFTRVKCGVNYMDYLYYSKRKMIQLFRKEYGLQRKHLTIIEV